MYSQNQKYTCVVKTANITLSYCYLLARSFSTFFIVAADRQQQACKTRICIGILFLLLLLQYFMQTTCSSNATS